MYFQNIASAIKDMSINDVSDSIFEKYYKRIVFSNENSYCSMKNLKKRFVIV